MSGPEMRTVTPEEAALRLDRWFRRHFPALAHGRLEKLLRTGQVRVEGRRAKAGQRLESGQTVRIPPQLRADGEGAVRDRPATRQGGQGGHDGTSGTPPVAERDAAMLRAAVLHRDEHLIVIDKPAGLAVQGGSGTARHVDGMLDALRFGHAERPRLVHRLDRDTSGVLLLARTATVARDLGRLFQGRDVQKLYWAAVAGLPRADRGRIDLSLAKRGGAREKVHAGVADDDAQRAQTLYRVVDHAARRAAWVAFMPLTGRTHQIRVHAAALGTPILGDGKYGGRAAFPEGMNWVKRLHLHARAIRLPHPAGGVLEVSAPLPDHMADSWQQLGFDGSADEGIAVFSGAERSWPAFTGPGVGAPV